MATETTARLPNFLLIGAMKTGTTSLYRYLEQHPDIFMSPEKEPSFFGFENGVPRYTGPGDSRRRLTAVTDFQKYARLFAGVRAEKAVGEASTVYIYMPGTAQRIQRRLPRVRIVATLRDPAERAFSNFMHMRQLGREPEHSFARTLKLQEERVSRGWAPAWHYVQRGFYYEQLLPFFECFGADRIHVILYDDLKANAALVVSKLCAFLGVDAAWRPARLTRYNASGIPRSRLLHRFLWRQHPRLRRWLPIPDRLRKAWVHELVGRNLARAELPAESRQLLVEIYREDVRRLEGLIGRDLSQWLAVRP